MDDARRSNLSEDVASVTTRIHGPGKSVEEPFHLTQIEPEPLLIRLLLQLRSAAGEFASDPLGFVRSAFAADKRDRRRHQLLYSGFALGVAIYAALLTLVLVVGLKKILHVNPVVPDNLVWLPPGPALAGPAGIGNDGASKGDTGGGGSGQKDPNPVSNGVLPDTAPHPPIVRPNPSNISLPSLPVRRTVVGPVVETASVPAPVGLPGGSAGDFAPGPGDGGGIGTGKGTGAGSGTGGGAGPGSGGNKGGGDAGLPGGSGSRLMADYDWAKIKSRPGNSDITWIRRPLPVVTPEAQKAVSEPGQVWMRATFRADGTITDIEVIHGIDFMTESAIESLKNSKFRPAMVNGVPITVTGVRIAVPVKLSPVGRH